jgi:trk system potassium uptake protein TrkA
MRSFAVIGLGNFGAAVAVELTDLKCRVTAVDQDRTKVEALPETIYQLIVGDARDKSFLENLGVTGFDSFVVSTGRDWYASILITLHLRELKAKRIVVKASSLEHARILEKVGADEAIIPEKQMANRLSHSLAHPNLIDHIPLTGDYLVAEVSAPNRFSNKKLKDLRLRSEHEVQVIAVKDGRRGTYEFAPGGEYTVKSSDTLVVLGRETDIAKFEEAG